MDSFEIYVRRVFFGALALAVIPAGVLVLAGHPDWSRGIFLGGAASLVNLLLMACNVRQKAGSLSSKGAAASFGNYALRMGTITAALTWAALDGRISLWAAAPALFCVQAVIVFGGVTGWLEGPDGSTK